MPVMLCLPICMFFRVYLLAGRDATGKLTIMKRVGIWITVCLILGFGAGLWYLNRPSVIEVRNEQILTNATPNPSAPLVFKTFHNQGHKFTLQFFADGLVTTGKLAASAKQDAVLARPGRTPTSFVVFADPIDDSENALRTDCGSRTPTQVVFTVDLYGNKVSVCHNATAPFAVYTMDFRATGTWEQITLFNNGMSDMTKSNEQLKTILGSLSVD
jgi:hypothetical protein